MKPLIDIAYEAATAHGVTTYDLVQKSRKARIVRARWAYFQAAREEGYTLTVIGKFVNRGHDTVLHGLNQLRKESLEKANKELIAA